MNDDGAGGLHAVIHPDGSAVLTVDETPYRIGTTAAEDARREIVERAAAIAAQVGQPVPLLVEEPDGAWPLRVHPDGAVESDEGRTHADAVDDPAPQPAPAPDAADDPATAPTPVAAASPAAATGTPEADTDTEADTEPEAPAPGSGTPGPEASAPTATPRPTRHGSRTGERPSFLTPERAEEPATRGWRRGFVALGMRLPPGAAERREREDIAAVSQPWATPRTIAVVNGKGGSGKTPTAILLASVFARRGGAGVLAWDNNQTRGTLGWRTEKAAHDATLHDLLPEAERLLTSQAQSADLARFVHHQSQDRFDVLRSQPIALAEEQRMDSGDVSRIHAVAAKYYRLIIMDSGNDESDPMWLRMIEHTDQLVVATTTRGEHAEAGALLLEALAGRDERTAALANGAVTIVSQADPNASADEVRRVVRGFGGIARDVATIPYDPAMIGGPLRFDALRPVTQRAWLSAAATIARGL